MKLLLGLTLWCACAAASILAPPGFQVVTFASGLAFPTGMTQLFDGSLLVAETVNNQNHNGYPNFYWGNGELVRFTDTNQDGVADGPGTVVASNLGGAITRLQALDNGTIMAVTTGNTTANGLHDQDILFLNSNYTRIGDIHIVSAATEVMAGAVQTGPGAWKIVFGISSGGDDGTPGGNATLTGLLNTTAPQGSVVEVPVTLSGGTVTAGSLQVLATGVRNTSNPIVAPNGDIYIGDNGYDANGAPVNPDTLDRIPAGASAPWFGLPGNYIAYGTGQVVGGGFTPPFVAFQPENGVDSFGISGLAFAPSDFPAQYQGGMFASFGGNYNYPGTANLTDPLVFISSTGAYTHFIESGQDGWGTVGDLLAAGGALYAPVMFTGTDSPWQENTGVIYAILPAPEPDTWLACAVFGCLLPIARRRRGH